eukprot:1158398-Pelagomonas_calceolata.AAC.9
MGGHGAWTKKWACGQERELERQDMMSKLKARVAAYGVWYVGGACTQDSWGAATLQKPLTEGWSWSRVTGKWGTDLAHGSQGVAWVPIPHSSHSHCPHLPDSSACCGHHPLYRCLPLHVLHSPLQVPAELHCRAAQRRGASCVRALGLPAPPPPLPPALSS